MPRVLSLIAASSAALLTLGLVGCGGSEPDINIPGGNNTAPAGESEESGAEQAAGAAEATFGEHSVSISEGVQCAGFEGTFAIGNAQAAAEGNTAIAVVMAGEDATTAQAVTVNTEEGITLVSAEGAGSSEISKDGNTYTVTGTGQVVDTNNPTAGEQSEFEIIVTCP